MLEEYYNELNKQETSLHVLIPLCFKSFHIQLQADLALCLSIKTHGRCGLKGNIYDSNPLSGYIYTWPNISSQVGLSYPMRPQMRAKWTPERTEYSNLALNVIINHNDENTTPAAVWCVHSCIFFSFVYQFCFSPEDFTHFQTNTITFKIKGSLNKLKIFIAFW